MAADKPCPQLQPSLSTNSCRKVEGFNMSQLEAHAMHEGDF